MALREFTDSEGRVWRAWDVPPRRPYSHRRTGAERRTAPTPGFAPERRVLADRRVCATPWLDCGWLCFESGSEKRRLYPPPQAWDACTDQEMAALCRAGKAGFRA